MAAPVEVPSTADVRVTVTRTVQHRCPYVEESDHGTVEISWTVAGGTVELHSLDAYLDGYADSRISHEDLIDRIRHDLAVLTGITGVTVTGRYTTAGLHVEVTADAVLGNAVRASGA